jgi:hypothetical protein
MNLPGLWPVQKVQGFMVCREPANTAKGIWTHPVDLADDLGDYVQPRRLPSDYTDWRAPLKDTAFAEAAALARLRYEHFRRLCSKYKPDVGALGWSAFATARVLFGQEAGRADLMLKQLDAYLAKLVDEFEPTALAIIGSGLAANPGAIIIFAPTLLKPGRIQQASWPDLLKTLMDLAGLNPTAKESVLASLRLDGESGS